MPAGESDRFPVEQTEFAEFHFFIGVIQNVGRCECAMKCAGCLKRIAEDFRNIVNDRKSFQLPHRRFAGYAESEAWRFVVIRCIVTVCADNAEIVVWSQRVREAACVQTVHLMEEKFLFFSGRIFTENFDSERFGICIRREVEPAVFHFILLVGDRVSAEFLAGGKRNNARKWLCPGFCNGIQKFDDQSVQSDTVAVC